MNHSAMKRIPIIVRLVHKKQITWNWIQHSAYMHTCELVRVAAATTYSDMCAVCAACHCGCWGSGCWRSGGSWRRAIWLVLGSHMIIIPKYLIVIKMIARGLGLRDTGQKLIWCVYHSKMIKNIVGSHTRRGAKWGWHCAVIPNKNFILTHLP